ncbi:MULTISPECIES: methyltransferase [Actinomadura]|uniref:Polyketide biosynthesis methyltransferase n=1 Tax=Actinomadura litoris TaxID=2678616 RepID=A0A7K1LA36_9ACTN|nr:MULTISPECIES: methyltransferase [Actinomadura]MBT2213302.1 polyketide biosynthesis methyltransferase [Actinomadura sp. NEAU-AAG7]MUN41297.1 polyketide biosynthesis methyltransferase [Actinomadura litoris]
MSHPAPGTDPSAILGVATGYMAAKQLFAASEAGLFAALAGGPATASELAERAGIPERTARILADTMAGLGLLTREDGRYANSPATSAYLAGGTQETDLRPFLAFLDAISYGHWLGFGDTTRTAEPQKLDLAGDRMQTFLGGVMTYNALHAKMLADNFDFTRFSRILDFGGLSGSFLAEALRSAENAHGTFLSGGELVEFARKVLEDAGVGDRIDVVQTDPLTGEVPEGFDLVLLEHVVHRFDAEQNKAIVERARRAAAPGATLVLLDFFLDSNPEQRVLDAVHAGEYLVIDGTVVYPEDEVRGWLSAAGWEPVETRELPGSPRIIIAEAR